MKKCSKCKQIKKLDQFHQLKGSTDGKHAWCADCKNKVWRESQRGRYQGISPAQYNFIMLMFHNQCAMSELGNCRGKLGLDHDHQTGEIRGVLCISHNRNLAHFGDNVNAIKTLERYFYGDLDALPAPTST